MHDPTTLNRQGNDVGDEYRSIIFYHDDAQKKVAEDYINNDASKLWDDQVVTQLIKYDKFWPADEDNQDFFNKNPSSGYCQVIINPKIQKLRQKFASKLSNQYEK
ncbi:MAG TPA: peptide-methionine (S)-S-oxide reductase, partial [Patescibacteria group bacterium]|nr:peptide-methionine (S)-S-oxide reductase [Patescibacteria group bacterium]